MINGEKNPSDEAKEKAIIGVVRSKEKEQKKIKYIVISAIILIIILIFCGIYFYKVKSNKLDKYYERNYQMASIARNADAFLKYRYDNKYPDFYGGMYISDDAYNLVIQIVKDKIPKEGTQEYFYYNELYTVDKKIKIEYVKYSYNELEFIYNKINDYIEVNNLPEVLNYWYIDIYRNRVVVNYLKPSEELQNEFKTKITDSEAVIFESAIDNIDKSNEFTNYPTDIGTDILEKHEEILLSIQTGNKSCVPVSLSLYVDGTYELFTAYETCISGRLCNSILKYSKSIKGTYNYDIDKILKNSTNANDKNYDMKNLPEYEIYLGEKYIKKYDTIMFTVEKGKKNKYLNELLDLIDIDLSKCAKKDYK